MLAHNIKDILTIVPEALGLVKSASLEEEFPVNSKDSAIASFLRVEYLEKVACKPVDTATKELVKKAAHLYGVLDQATKLASKLSIIEKTASSKEETMMVKQAEFEGSIGGFLSITKTAEAARALSDTYGEDITSDEVKRYSGRGFLNKEASLVTLANRYHATKDPSFVKVARIASTIKENDFDSIQALCDTVTSLDKKAGLDLIGFNFYKEALFTKEAQLVSSMYVNLAGENVPYEKILRFGKERIGATLGKDIAADFTESPVDNKAMLEALPRDLQVMLKSLVK